MELIACKVISGKYGPQVCHEGIFYKVGSFSEKRVRIGGVYKFLLEETEHAGRTNHWANLPKPKEGEEDKSEEIEPVSQLTMVEDKPRARASAQPSLKPIEKLLEKFVNEAIRIADALEGIEDLLDRQQGGISESD